MLVLNSEHNLLQALPQVFILMSHAVPATKKKTVQKRRAPTSGSLKEIQMRSNHFNRN